jgi:hypothetical protein
MKDEKLINMTLCRAGFTACPFFMFLQKFKNPFQKILAHSFLLRDEI